MLDSGSARLRRGIRGLILLALLLPFAGVISGCRLLPKEEVEDIPALIKPPDEQLVTEALTEGPIEEELRAFATVSSTREQVLYFYKTGQIRQVFVKYDEVVKKGQLLVAQETGDLEFQLRLAQINLEQEEIRFRQQYGDGSEAERAVCAANLELARAQLDLDQTEDRLETEGKITTVQRRKELQRDLERARLILAQVKMNLERLVASAGDKNSPAQRLAFLGVERARLEYERLSRQMEESELRAPFDGKVSDLAVARGNPVAAFAPVARISNLKNLDLIASVSMAERDRIKIGQRVKVMMDDGTFRLGRVISIYLPTRDKTETNAEPKWDVPIRMDQLRFSLEYGKMHTVFFILKSVPKAVLAPNSAVREDVNGRKYLRVVDGKRRRDVYVETGIVTDTQTQIVKGAKAGMTVVCR